MILLYHKIDTESKNYWWVSSDAFYRQLVQLSDKEVVYLDDYDPGNPKHVVITFDGIYQDVLKYAAPLLHKFGYPFELFMQSSHIGKDNSFDKNEPRALFATIKELEKLVGLGGRLQWHTRTHRDLTKISGDELREEIISPKEFKKMDKSGFKWFAYPYGKHNKESREIVKNNYTGGVSCDDGNFTDKEIWPRVIADEKTTLNKTRISVIIPCYNYANFLVEAIESVLNQTYLPDEIILSDDASTDHTYEIMKVYESKYPGLIKARRNQANQGIEKHFNKAVSETSGDFVCLLGADNRMPGNYIEQCFKTLIENPDTAIAYTDFALFGSRAESVYRNFNKSYQRGKIEHGVYLVEFPQFNTSSKKYLLTKGNFIHGSSMYRRSVFDEIGGYASRKSGPEDYSLFQSMIKAGWSAKKTNKVYLEYRQHSTEQANLQFSYFAEVSFLRQQFKEGSAINDDLQRRVSNLDAHLKAAIDDNNQLRADIEVMKKSKFWKTKEIVRKSKKAIKNPKLVAGKIKNKLKNS